MSTPKRRFNLLSLTFIVLCFKKSLLIHLYIWPFIFSLNYAGEWEGGNRAETKSNGARGKRQVISPRNHVC